MAKDTKEEVVAEEGDEFDSIDELQNQGIGVADIQKLKQAGICTIAGIQWTTRRSMLRLKGFSEAKVDKVKEAAEKLSPAPFSTAKELGYVREKVHTISTGSTAFDGMLGGGIKSMSISEVFGEFRCGKTQLGHTLCVTCQLPRSMGGAEGRAAFIDTEGTFRPDRIRSIAERFNFDADQVLENIIYARAQNSENQMTLIRQLASMFAEDGRFRLLVIDSIMALFRVDYSGRGELAERQQKLNQMLNALTSISEQYNIAVFITNQVQADPGATMMFAANDRKPVGGHVIAHASATRVLLRKGRGEERVAKLNDSPDMPESECSYTISTGGISDVQ